MPGIDFIIPYSQTKNLAKEYNRHMENCKPGNYVCFTDGDILLFPKFGHRIHEVIEEHGPAFYTCLTNRCNPGWQRYMDEPHGDEITQHCEWASDTYEYHGSKVVNHTHSQLWSGYLMVIPKDLWTPLPETGKLLGVDNMIHQQARDNGHRILLMTGIYVYHWYSGYDGNSGHSKRDKSHLI